MSLLKVIALVFVALWVVGFLIAHIGGSFIHALIVIALVIFVFDLLTGRRAV